MSLMYVITDDFRVIAEIDLAPTERIACHEKYSVIDADSLKALIEAGYPVVMPEDPIPEAIL